MRGLDCSNMDVKLRWLLSPNVKGRRDRIVELWHAMVRARALLLSVKLKLRPTLPSTFLLSILNHGFYEVRCIESHRVSETSLWFAPISHPSVLATSRLAALYKLGRSELALRLRHA